MIPFEDLGMRGSVRFGMMRPKYRRPPAKRTKVQSLFFSYSSDGRKNQCIVYVELAAVDCLSFNKISTSSFIRNSMQRNTTNVAHTSHTTIHPKVKEFWEVAKEETLRNCKKLGAGSP